MARCWLDFCVMGGVHGLGLVIHRAYKKLGFAMPKVLAWFITFNFVNIAWIFFRAKSFDDAMKVLKGMFGLNGVVIQGKYEKYLGFLSDFGVSFGRVTTHINTGNTHLVWVIVVLLITLFFKNSNQRVELFEADKKYLAFSVGIFIYSVFSLNKISEFLYFNF